MRFSVHQASRIGGRKYNQDRVAYAYSDAALLMVLADGMGGHLRGEAAAQTAIETYMDAFKEVAQPRVSDPEGFLRATMQRAHQSILQYAQDMQLSDTPGTTCVAALVQDNEVCWAHAGDSRLYQLRDHKVLTRTRDHSLVQLWADEGKISAREMKTHPERNKITNCLCAAIGDMFQVDFTPASLLQPGDILLLCSDGLWSPLDDEEIGLAFFNSPARPTALARLKSRVFRAKAEESPQPQPLPLPDTLEQLLDQALKRGGAHADNTTAIVVRWGAAEEEHDASEPICEALDPDTNESLSNVLGRTQGSLKKLDAS